MEGKENSEIDLCVSSFDSAADASTFRDRGGNQLLIDGLLFLGQERTMHLHCL